MKLVIEVEFGNDAMQTVADADAAIHRAIYERNDRVGGPLRPTLDYGPIHDSNGNMVGRWAVVEPTPTQHDSPAMYRS